MLSYKRVKALIIEHKIDLLFIFLFLVFPIFAFWRNFDFSGVNRTYFNVEFTGFYYPDFALGTKLLQHPNDLLWDPYNLLGIPLIGGIDRLGLFYPIKFIFYVIAQFFHPNVAMYIITYHSLFHISLAGIFTYIFVRKVFGLHQVAAFIAGLAYMFNGNFITFIVLPNHFSGSVFLPLILYFIYLSFEKKNYKYSVLAGLFMAPTLLSGYTPVFLYNNMFMLLFAMYFAYTHKQNFLKVILYMTVINVTALALSAVTLLPNLENSALSNRQHIKNSVFGAGYFSYLTNNIIYFFFPYFYAPGDSPTTYNYGYIGIAPLILVYYAVRRNINRNVLFFIFAAFIFMALSLGEGTFIHSIAYNFVPQYASFRRPAFIQYIVALCLAIVAAFGLDKLLKQNEVDSQIKKEYWVYSLMLIFFFLQLTSRLFNDSSSDRGRDAVFTTALFYFPALFTLMFMNLRHNLTKTFLILLVVLDLFTFTYKGTRHNSNVDPRMFNSHGELTRWMKENTSDNSRVFLNDVNARYNSANVELYQIWGYYGLYPDTYVQTLAPFETDLGSVKVASPVYDLLGVKYFALKDPVDLSTVKNIKLAREYKIQNDDSYKFMTPSGTMMNPGEKIYVYENTDKMPRAFFISKIVTAENDGDASEMITEVDLQNEVIITRDFGEYPEIANGKSEVEITNYENSKVEIAVENEKPGVLVLTDSYYPGWEVYVDGVRTEVLKADVGLRGVYLDGGTHNVKFNYFPKQLYRGALISAVSVVVITVIFIFPYFKKFSRFDRAR